MSKPRFIDLVIAIGFLAAILSASILQAIMEARHGESPQALTIFRLKPSAGHFRSYEQGLEEASLVIRLLRPWTQYIQFMLFGEMGEKAIAGRDGWLFYRPGVQYLTERPHSQRAAAIAAQTVAAVVDFRNQLAARNIRLLVVPVPNKESVYPEKLSRRATHLRGVRGAETQAVLEGLKAAEVEVVDLFRAFADAKAVAKPSSPPLYLAQDTHWSPGGMELAARIAANRSVERNWVKLGSVAYELKSAPVAHAGDLVRMLQSPPIERTVVPETIPCLQVVNRETGNLYRDAQDAAVLVLGDSFLRIYEQDQPGAAGFIAHLARELRQPVASMVNDGGASTLVRQELYRRPAMLRNKQLVIWEFVERDIRFGTEGWQRVPLPPELRGETGSTVPEPMPR